MRRWFGKANPAKNYGIAQSDRPASPDNIVKLKRQNQPKEIRR